MRSVSFLDRLNAIGVATALAALGHSLHASNAAWSRSGHLVFALALFPVATWASLWCLRTPERHGLAFPLSAGIALTAFAAAGASIPLSASTVRALAFLGALSLALGHLGCGYARADAAPDPPLHPPGQR